MKNFGISVIALGLVGLSGCHRLCKDAETKVIQPVAQITSFLETNSSGPQLQQNCTTLIHSLASIPNGAEDIRRIADTRFSITDRHCEAWATGTHFVCYWEGGYRWGREVCYPQAYDYCVSWHYSTYHDPEYETAIQLSENLDALYDRGSQVCALATAGKLDDASSSAKSLLDFIRSQIAPQGYDVYARACKS